MKKLVIFLFFIIFGAMFLSGVFVNNVQGYYYNQVGSFSPSCVGLVSCSTFSCYEINGTCQKPEFGIVANNTNAGDAEVTFNNTIESDKKYVKSYSIDENGIKTTTITNVKDLDIKNGIYKFNVSNNVQGMINKIIADSGYKSGSECNYIPITIEQYNSIKKSCSEFIPVEAMTVSLIPPNVPPVISNPTEPLFNPELLSSYPTNGFDQPPNTINDLSQAELLNLLQGLLSPHETDISFLENFPPFNLTSQNIIHKENGDLINPTGLTQNQLNNIELLNPNLLKPNYDETMAFLENIPPYILNPPTTSPEQADWNNFVNEHISLTPMENQSLETLHGLLNPVVYSNQYLDYNFNNFNQLIDNLPLTSSDIASYMTPGVLNPEARKLVNSLNPALLGENISNDAIFTSIVTGAK